MEKIGTMNKTTTTIKKHDFHVKKKFGQNFLTDQNILNKIVNIPDITNETLVVEIGPGFGSMTELLLKKAKRVLAYEIDKDLIPILQENFKNQNLTLKNEDILKSNIDGDIKALEEQFDNVVLVANLPYYITTPIIMKILEESTLIKQLTVMMQLEVARRFTSKPSTKDYNSLSVFIQYKTNAVLALKVPRSVFVPAPNVDSAVVRLDIKETIDLEPNNQSLFFKLVKLSFTQRRKILTNNLSTGFGIPKEQINSMLISLGYSQTIRAESLSVEEFVYLCNEFEREIV
jgi:16S rRNA (adenine1518-N6/adenine1519-N6)-dimethyltransferase